MNNAQLSHEELKKISDEYTRLLYEIELSTDRWLELSELAL